ncbi:peroxisome biogenesis protein 6 isoform X3 [Nymphaea colorata]|uniref:peroxisome biogenesis protein 6 isoform X3 n=1 Tax=Nymphaea colorata TaxID=210225 RepID=UPI00129E0725|nr:peroxisome biogenesis protein 6 isoform X3 [Nymphaea colorata]
MGRTRKPLLLTSNTQLLHSFLRLGQAGEQRDDDRNSSVAWLREQNASLDASSYRLRAGLLRFPSDGIDQVPDGFDESHSVGVSVSILKRLRVTSGSLVLVRNLLTNIGRIGRIIVLGSPVSDLSECNNQSTHSLIKNALNVLPCCNVPPNIHLADQGTAYLAPLMAFNIGLHLLCMKSLIHGNHEPEKAAREHDQEFMILCDKSDVHVEVLPLDLIHQLSAFSTLVGKMPKHDGKHIFLRYASHLSVSFVKIPKCGALEPLKGELSQEQANRQELIDIALHNYFKTDRFFSKGDVFGVQIKWNCNSEFCTFCSNIGRSNSAETIYFKVVFMEPADEMILRINCNQTSLVLGGSVASRIPPELLSGRIEDFVPPQQDVLQILFSLLAPTLCPSSISSKFRLAILLHGPAGSGKRTVIRFVARSLGLHVLEYSCHDLMDASDREISQSLRNAFLTAQRYSPAVLLLQHFDVLGSLSSNGGYLSDQIGVASEVANVVREFTEPNFEDKEYDLGGLLDSNPFLPESETMSHKILLVAAAGRSEGLPQSIRRCFSHEISMGVPSESQRTKMLLQSLESQDGGDDVIRDLVAQTSGFLPRDIQALIADAGTNFIQRLSDNVHISNFKNRDESISVKGINKTLCKDDMSKALEWCKKRTASALGTPKVPNVKWEDVGGLEDVKKSILDTVQLPLMHKDLFSSGLRKRSGVLLYGPPGTGKTLLAKAVATECSLNFLSVKGPELINMYIGESEKNVRDIFQKARSARPCVIFFDELDALAPARGSSGDSGGVMDRVVSQMLAEIDGLNESTQDLFIIGASNRPDLIDPALLRPGRFDKLLYVGVDADPSYRERVLRALTRKFKLHENVSLLSIAKKCPPNFTGADLYALCADAWFQAAKNQVSGHQSSMSINVDEPNSVVIEHDDFIRVLADMSPSLSMAELRKYEALRNQFEGSTK